VTLTKAEHNRLYRQRHPERKREQNIRYRKQHRKQLRAKQIEYRKTCPEWYEENVEKCLFRNARARARKKGIPFSIELTDVVIPEHCPILGYSLKVGVGKAYDYSPSIDRIDPTKGYTRGNVWVISHRANTIKSDATPSELRRVATILEQHMALPSTIEDSIWCDDGGSSCGTTDEF
jgi:hypothetical protein